MSKIVDVEGLLGREILAYSPAYQDRLVDAALVYWRATGFPYPSVTALEIRQELSNLAASDRLVNGHAHGLMSTVGLRIANSSHPQIWHIKVRGKSCVDVFADDKRLVRALAKAPGFWPGRRCWNAQSIRTLMRISHKMRPSNFRPVVARQLIRAFSDDGGRVLDFSAGFGGRLLGAVSLDRHYIGIDPARAQIKGLRRIYGQIRNLVPGTAELHRACAEEHLPQLCSDTADLVISSPPYYDRERYSVEPNQSYLRYPGFPDWVDYFLRPVLLHSARVLKRGGIMLLNVTDRPAFNLKGLAVNIVGGQLALRGWIPYRMRTNPVESSRSVLKSEPILVFQKSSVKRESVRNRIRMFGGVSL